MFPQLPFYPMLPYHKMLHKRKKAARNAFFEREMHMESFHKKAPETTLPGLLRKIHFSAI
jgi:hypothetical protein